MQGGGARVETGFSLFFPPKLEGARLDEWKETETTQTKKNSSWTFKKKKKKRRRRKPMQMSNTKIEKKEIRTHSNKKATEIF